MNVAHLYGKLAHKPASVNSAVYHGGAQKVACQIALSMREYSDKVFFLSDDDDGTAIVQMFHREGILHRQVKFSVRPLQWMNMVFNVLNLVRNEHIDVLHCHSRFTLFCAWTVSKLTGIKLIYTAHSIYGNKWLTRFFFGGHIIAISLQVKRNLIDYFGIKESKISLIYNGVDTEKVKAEAVDGVNKSCGLVWKNPVVVVVGKLVELKGIEYMLLGLPEVIKEHALLKVLIVGDGPFREKLENLTNQLNIEDHVVFCGSQADPRPFIQRAVCLCSSSLQEGFGCVLLEAMFLGVPVVATEVGVAPEIILSGQNGLLVPLCNTQKIAEALLQLLSNPATAKKMGKQARLSVEKEFRLERMLESYKHYYEKLF